MKPKTAWAYAELVREEAALVQRTQNEQETLRRYASSLACERIAQLQESGKSDTSKEQRIEDLRAEMIKLLDLLMSAPENPKFKELKFIDEPAGHKATYNARRRDFEVAGYGPLQVTKLYTHQKGEEENRLISRLDIGGLPDINEVSLRNSPTLVEPHNHRFNPWKDLRLNDPSDNELLRLQDELETITDICKAAGLLPTDGMQSSQEI